MIHRLLKMWFLFFAVVDWWDWCCITGVMILLGHCRWHSSNDVDIECFIVTFDVFYICGESSKKTRHTTKDVIYQWFCGCTMQVNVVRLPLFLKTSLVFLHTKSHTSSEWHRWWVGNIPSKQHLKFWLLKWRDNLPQPDFYSILYKISCPERTVESFSYKLPLLYSQLLPWKHLRVVLLYSLV